MTRELLQQALDALEWASDLNQVASDSFTIHDAITALREALAAPMPEPSDMVMVPKEPTPDMARVGRKAVAAVADKMEAAKQLAVHVIDFWQQVGHTPANEIYRAMIAAAPPAAPAPATSADYAMGYAEGFNDACKPTPVVREPLTDEMVEAEFVSRGDDKGQGLHPYWKDAFREGFNFARSQLSAAPAAPVPLTDDQIDEIWDGSFDSADPKRQLSFRQIITRAIEAHHGIGGSNG